MIKTGIGMPKSQSSAYRIFLPSIVTWPKTTNEIKTSVWSACSGFASLAAAIQESNSSSLAIRPSHSFRSRPKLAGAWGEEQHVRMLVEESCPPTRACISAHPTLSSIAVQFPLPIRHKQ